MRSACRMCVLVCLFAVTALAQTSYRVITVSDGGTIEGTVKWVGPVPKAPKLPISKDPQICDPESEKTRDLERLLVGPDRGVANTVIYLVDISQGKAMDLPESRRMLDQKHCRYVPHILLVPQDGTLKMKSSDPTLHTIHMTGAASFNLPFPFQNQYIDRQMKENGVIEMKCNAGHVWMNGYTMVVPHPYFAVTDDAGHYRLTNVPPGSYRIQAWHEGWAITGNESLFDITTQVTVHRPLYTAPRTWTKQVTVSAQQAATVNFELSDSGAAAAK